MPNKKNKIKKSEKILITAALPYANGDIHIGHLLEYLQADIFSRFLKLQGKDALYICASDMHGTPIEVNAHNAGKKPLEFATHFWKEHQKDFASFLISFDHYSHTHTPENKRWTEEVYAALKKQGLITLKPLATIYCQNCNRSLPDRYVKGTCPHCGTEAQYGDVCERCNLALKGTDLLNPKCSLCGKTPIQKEGNHYFFRLRAFQDQLRKWLQQGGVQEEVRKWLEGWLNTGLEDWCISRDAPYFGFEIPDSKQETGELKYFYVWLDAPLGYISSTENYCLKKKKGRLEDYWKQGKVHHFIGKDIIYFHYLFWPALLLALKVPLPTLNTHGFITVNGQKMSKSRGTFFTAKEFLKLYSAESLRFFYASHLDRSVVDVDVNFEEFRSLNNDVLVGSLGNFCYRVLTFAQQYGTLRTIAREPGLQKKIQELQQAVFLAYENLHFKSAVRNILAIADLGNKYFQESQPWKDPASAESKAAVGFCVNLVRNLGVLVSPILPEFSAKVARALGKKALGKKEIGFSWKGKIHPVEKLVEKVEHLPKKLQFPLDLVVGKILQVRDHPRADKLYLLNVDFGKEQRQVVAGLKGWLSPGQLQGQKAVFVRNLKPATLRGEKSEAMLLAADDGMRVVPLFVEKTPVGEPVQVSGWENNTAEISFEEFQKLILQVQSGKVWYESRSLQSAVEEIQVLGVQDGAKVK